MQQQTMWSAFDYDHKDDQNDDDNNDEGDDDEQQGEAWVGCSGSRCEDL